MIDREIRRREGGIVGERGFREREVESDLGRDIEGQRGRERKEGSGRNVEKEGERGGKREREIK